MKPRIHPLIVPLSAVLLAAAPCVPALAQTANAVPVATPQNVLQLSATGQVEVQQDWLTLTLSATREGGDAASVQAELRKTVDAVLTELKKTAQPGQMDVRSGSFGVSPNYGRNGKINAWQGQAEVVLEGRDFTRITEAAARVPLMSIGDLTFSLSRELRARVESQAQAQAIEGFKAKADAVVKAFGFAGYTLREVSVGGQGAMPPQRYRAEVAAAARASAPVAVEAGNSLVTVTVSGTVQAH
jgi:predicted secreted protein